MSSHLFACPSPACFTGRMTLLLGPPSGGKSVLLQALSGRLRSGRNLRVSCFSARGLELLPEQTPWQVAAV